MPCVDVVWERIFEVLAGSCLFADECEDGYGNGVAKVLGVSPAGRIGGVQTHRSVFGGSGISIFSFVGLLGCATRIRGSCLYGSRSRLRDPIIFTVI